MLLLFVVKIKTLDTFRHITSAICCTFICMQTWKSVFLFYFRPTQTHTVRITKANTWTIKTKSRLTETSYRFVFWPYHHLLIRSCFCRLLIYFLDLQSFRKYNLCQFDFIVLLSRAMVVVADSKLALTKTFSLLLYFDLSINNNRTTTTDYTCL